MQLLRLTIKHLRAIDEFSLDVVSPEGHPARRRILLGANGFGKTTILDAVAEVFGAFDDRYGACRLAIGDIRRASAPDAAPAVASVEILATLCADERRAVRAYFPNVPDRASIQRSPGAYFTTSFQAQLDAEQASPFYDAARAAMLAAPGAPCVYLTAERGVLTDSDVSPRELEDFDPKAGCLAPGRERFRSLAARLALAYAAPEQNDRDHMFRRMWGVLKTYLPRMPRPVGVKGLTLLFDNQRGARDVRLSELSHGERAVLLIFAELALRNPAHGVVLIDELEQHLHPRWQRDVMEGLLALVPTAQYLMATQSISLVAADPDDRIKVGDWDEDAL